MKKQMDKDELATILAQLGMKQKELASLLSLSPQQVNSWVGGRTKNGVPGAAALLLRILADQPDILKNLNKYME